ncbi:MAG: WD40 repeat-like protein [Aureobasidium pullulans]|nr:MAG: WD40 repeat-like protein [Aureobasidium pullulans]
MGFMVRPADLNPFWRYVFHYIDYQSYVFEGMMVNEFADRTYTCPKVDGKWNCAYKDEKLNAQGLIPGTGLLDTYGYKTGRTGEYIGILLAIILVYRALGWFVLYVRRT